MHSSSVMPEVTRSSVPHPETEVGPSYLPYFVREIEDLFSQKVDLVPSLSSKAFATTGEDVDDTNVDNNLHESKEAASSRALFCNSFGDKLPLNKNDRLKASLKKGVTVLGQEVDGMLDPVLKMYKINKLLSDKEHVANNPSSADSDVNQSPFKKQKLLSSLSSTCAASPVGAIGSQSCGRASGSEDTDNKNPNIISSKESQSRGRKRICLHCKTTNTPQWRQGPAGAGTLCNACGIRYKKKELYPLGFNEVEDKCKQELDDDLPILLSIAGSDAKETVKRYSDEIFVKLGDMEQQLEQYLNAIMSKCRTMTREEKQELRKLIQSLPPKNLDRVVDIIVQNRKLPEGYACNEIHIDLEKEDSVTLWRLYYYVKAVENAKAKSSRA